MLDFVISRLNHLPSKNEISVTISPSTIVLGEGAMDMKFPSAEFGSYVLLFTKTQNNLKRRSVPYVALNPSNGYGGHYFMSFESDKQLHGYS